MPINDKQITEILQSSTVNPVVDMIKKLDLPHLLSLEERIEESQCPSKLLPVVHFYLLLKFRENLSIDPRFSYAYLNVRLDEFTFTTSSPLGTAYQLCQASHKTTKKNVIIKIYDLILDDESSKTLETHVEWQENVCRLLSLQGHIPAVELVGIGIERCTESTLTKERLYIVLEDCVKNTLYEALARRTTPPPPLNVRIKYALDLLSQIVYLDQRDLRLGILTSRAICISQDNQLKLSHFLWASKPQFDRIIDEDMTYYIAPEVRSDGIDIPWSKSTSKSTDLFSIGLVLLEILTWSLIGSDKPAARRFLLTQCPEILVRYLEKCISPNPEDREIEITTLMERLQKYLYELSPPITTKVEESENDEQITEILQSPTVNPVVDVIKKLDLPNLLSLEKRIKESPCKLQLLPVVHFYLLLKFRKNLSIDPHFSYAHLDVQLDEFTFTQSLSLGTAYHSYQASHKTTKKNVIIKFYDLHLDKSSNIRDTEVEWQENVCRLLSLQGHIPAVELVGIGIERYKDFGLTKERLYIVLEDCVKDILYKALARRTTPPPPLNVRIKYALDLLSQIEYLDQCDLRLGILTSRAICISQDNQLKLNHLYLWASPSEWGCLQSYVNTDIRPYAAPEVRRGEALSLSKSIDLFSIGLVLLEILTWSLIGSDKRDARRSLLTQCPEMLVPYLEKCISPPPRDRKIAITTLMEQLQKCLHELFPPTPDKFIPPIPMKVEKSETVHLHRVPELELDQQLGLGSGSKLENVRIKYAALKESLVGKAKKDKLANVEILFLTLENLIPNCIEIEIIDILGLIAAIERFAKSSSTTPRPYLHIRELLETSFFEFFMLDFSRCVFMSSSLTRCRDQYLCVRKFISMPDRELEDAMEWIQKYNKESPFPQILLELLKNNINSRNQLLSRVKHDLLDQITVLEKSRLSSLATSCISQDEEMRIRFIPQISSNMRKPTSSRDSHSSSTSTTSSSSSSTSTTSSSSSSTSSDDSHFPNKEKVFVLAEEGSDADSRALAAELQSASPNKKRISELLSGSTTLTIDFGDNFIINNENNLLILAEQLQQVTHLRSLTCHGQYTLASNVLSRSHPAIEAIILILEKNPSLTSINCDVLNAKPIILHRLLESLRQSKVPLISITFNKLDPSLVFTGESESIIRLFPHTLKELNLFCIKTPRPSRAGDNPWSALAYFLSHSRSLQILHIERTDCNAQNLDIVLSALAKSLTIIEVRLPSGLSPVQKEKLDLILKRNQLWKAQKEKSFFNANLLDLLNQIIQPKNTLTCVTQQDFLLETLKLMLENLRQEADPNRLGRLVSYATHCMEQQSTRRYPVVISLLKTKESHGPLAWFRKKQPQKDYYNEALNLLKAALSELFAGIKSDEKSSLSSS